MRREMKIGIGIGVVVVACGLWYLVSGTPDGAPQNPDESLVSLPEDSAAPAAEPAVTERQEPAGALAMNEHDEPAGTEPGPTWLDHRSDSLVSPPVFDVAERSEPAADPPAVDTTRVPTLDTPGERVGLADVPGIATEVPRPGATPAAQPGTAAPTGMTPEPSSLADRRAPSPLVTAAGSTPSATTDRHAPEPADQPMKTHKVEAGDTFSSLAARYLGHAKHADRIAKANPSVDPRRLRIGMELRIPAAAESAAAPPGSRIPTADAGTRAAPPRTAIEASPIPDGRAYTVQQGQRWSDLAERFFKDANRWPELYELNRGRVPRNPNLLRAGTVIEIPPEAARATSPDLATTRPAAVPR